MAKKQRTFISGLDNARKEAEERNKRTRTRKWVVIGGFGQGVNGPIYKLDSVPLPKKPTSLERRSAGKPPWR